jgi:putative Holliday junction resolvase
MAVILALDPGLRRTGIAVCDPTGTLARPLLTHDRRSDGSLLELVASLCEEHSVERILVGLPLTQMNEEGSTAQAARGLAKKIQARVKLPVELVDERYSSLEADRVLAGKKAPKGRRDAVAAALILQTWLDAPGHDDPSNSQESGS